MKVILLATLVALAVGTCAIAGGVLIYSRSWRGAAGVYLLGGAFLASAFWVAVSW